MPGKVDEKKWQRAKAIVAEQKGHTPKDKDYGLVQHIYQGMKKEEESNSEMAEATTTNIERKAKRLKALMDQTTEDSPPWVVGKLSQAKTHVQDVMDYVGTDGVKKAEPLSKWMSTLGAIKKYKHKQTGRIHMGRPSNLQGHITVFNEDGSGSGIEVPEEHLEEVSTAAAPEPKCECGAASIGYKDKGPAHSHWCPMHETKKSEFWFGLSKAMKDWVGLKGVHKPVTGHEEEGMSEAGQKTREFQSLRQQQKGKFVEPSEYFKTLHLKQKARIRHEEVLAQIRQMKEEHPPAIEAPKPKAESYGTKAKPVEQPKFKHPVVEIHEKWESLKNKIKD